MEHQRLKGGDRGSMGSIGDYEPVDIESGMYSQLNTGTNTPIPKPLNIAAGGGGGSVGSGSGSGGLSPVIEGQKTLPASSQDGQGQVAPTRTFPSKPLAFSSGVANGGNGVKKEENPRRNDDDIGASGAGRSDKGD